MTVTPPPAFADTSVASQMDQLLGQGPDSTTQARLENSLDDVLLGSQRRILGVAVRPMVFSDILVLRKLGNQLLQGRVLADVDDSIWTASQILFVLSITPRQTISLLREGVGAFDERVLEFCATLDPTGCESLITDVLAAVNDATSTRVETSLPRSMQSQGGGEGNA